MKTFTNLASLLELCSQIALGSSCTFKYTGTGRSPSANAVARRLNQWLEKADRPGQFYCNKVSHYFNIYYSRHKIVEA